MTLDLESDRAAFRISRDPLGNLRERIHVFIERFVHLTGKMLDDGGMHVKVAVQPFLRRTWSDVLCFRLRGSTWSKSKQIKEFMAIIYNISHVPHAGFEILVGHEYCCQVLIFRVSQICDFSISSFKFLF